MKLSTGRCLFSLFLLALCFFPLINLKATTIRIGTYNIWNPLFELKYSGKNTWETRLPLIIENIVSSQCDVICLEEVGKKAYLDLLQSSEIDSRYMSFYISHAPSKHGQKEGRDGLAFFYNPEKFILNQLVQTHSGGRGRPTHRRDFYADLQLNNPKKPIFNFRIAGIHIDAENLAIGNHQLRTLVEDVLKESKGQEFVVVCGDFNEGESEPSRPRSQIMQEAGFITDGSLVPTRPEVLKVRHKGHIDWIYFKKLSSVDFELVPVAPIGDERASDHKLTITDIVISD